MAKVAAKFPGAIGYLLKDRVAEIDDFNALATRVGNRAADALAAQAPEACRMRRRFSASASST